MKQAQSMRHCIHTSIDDQHGVVLECGCVEALLLSNDTARTDVIVTLLAQQL